MYVEQKMREKEDKRLWHYRDIYFREKLHYQQVLRPRVQLRAESFHIKEGEEIFLDQDYALDVQKKRKPVWELIKLCDKCDEEKEVKAQSPPLNRLNPAWRLFRAFLEAASTVNVKVGE